MRLSGAEDGAVKRKGGGRDCGVRGEGSGWCTLLDVCRDAGSGVTWDIYRRGYTDIPCRDCRQPSTSVWLSLCAAYPARHQHCDDRRDDDPRRKPDAHLCPAMAPIRGRGRAPSARVRAESARVLPAPARNAGKTVHRSRFRDATSTSRTLCGETRGLTAAVRTPARRHAGRLAGKRLSAFTDVGRECCLKPAIVGDQQHARRRMSRRHGRAGPPCLQPGVGAVQSAMAPARIGR